jgi:hypothetical protein
MRAPFVPWLAALGWVVTAACGSSAPPATPTVSMAPTAPAYPNFTLSGTVSDSTSGAPIQGVLVQLAAPSPPPGPIFLSSDAAGRYQITGIPIRNETHLIQTGIVKLNAEPLMWPQDVGVTSMPERQALGRDGPNSRQLDNAEMLLTGLLCCSNSNE